MEPFWPRKASRERTVLDIWLRDLAPSPALYEAFTAGRVDWPGFVDRYHTELLKNREYFSELQRHNHNGGLTLIHGSADGSRNAAVALKMLLDRDAFAAACTECRV